MTFVAFEKRGQMSNLTRPAPKCKSDKVTNVDMRQSAKTKCESEVSCAKVRKRSAKAKSARPAAPIITHFCGSVNTFLQINEKTFRHLSPSRGPAAAIVSTYYHF